MRKPWMVGWSAVLCTAAMWTTTAIAEADVTTTVVADEIAETLPRDPFVVTGAEWVDVGAGAAPAGDRAAGFFRGFGPRGFPTDGSSFGVISSGTASHADTGPSTQSSAGVGWGTDARGAKDVTVLKVDINVKPGQTCLALDMVFMSEEYPEFVNSRYNDAAIVELDDNSWSASTGNILAPANFAFDRNGRALTVNSAEFTDEEVTNTEFDGATKLLTAATPVTAGPHSVYVSVFDMGDTSLDSALLIDNLRTEALSTDDCRLGARVADRDEDGLPDEWETNGYDFDNDGEADVDLPAMGADPDHKDLFLELDAMERLKLDPEALEEAVATFARSPLENPDGENGVTLHIDHGPGSVMNPKTGAKWGARSQYDELPFKKVLGERAENGRYDWSEFEAQKKAHFLARRAPVFRYGIVGNRTGAESGTVGIARDTPGSDIYLALGLACKAPGEGKCPGSRSLQTGTLLHEFGHSLGLRHGGRDDINFKPNYLSVMNYAFTEAGLMGERKWDYSRFGHTSLDTIDEHYLSENLGFLKDPDSAVKNYKTLIFCQDLREEHPKVVQVGASVDFDCDGQINGSSSVTRDINFDGDKTRMEPLVDWAFIKFVGGAVGGSGRDVLLSDTTLDTEPTLADLAPGKNAAVPPPTPTTGGADGIGDTTATLHGTRDMPDPGTVRFAYGTDAGALDRMTDAQQAGAGQGGFDASLTGLQPDTTYHYRALVETDTHQVVGATGSFRTGGETSVPAPPGTGGTGGGGGGGGNPGPAPDPDPPGSGTPGPSDPAPKPGARAKPDVCASPLKKASWKPCYRKLEKTACQSAKGAKRKAKCRTGVVNRVCRRASLTKKAGKPRKALKASCTKALRKR